LNDLFSSLASAGNVTSVDCTSPFSTWLFPFAISYVPKTSRPLNFTKGLTMIAVTLSLNPGLTRAEVAFPVSVAVGLSITK
jgi:hypothetical protein